MSKGSKYKQEKFTKQNPTQYELIMKEMNEKYTDEITKKDEENKEGNW